MFSSGAFQALWNPVSPPVVLAPPTPTPADWRGWLGTGLGAAQRATGRRRAAETVRVNREAKLVQWALEYRVGCAMLTLVEAGQSVSDAAAIELMELSGADIATVFRVLDRVRTDIANA